MTEPEQSTPASGVAVDRKGIVEVELDAGADVAVVTFGRGRNNFLTYELVERILDELAQLASSGCRAIVLRTASRHFCAGADFGGERPSQPGSPHIFHLVPRLYEVETPMVAAIGGGAIGAGLGLALAADFRVTTPSAYYLTNFTRIGITPGFGLSFTLPRLIGSQRAAEMFYTARRIGGEEAVSIGLADRLVEPGELDSAALNLARQIALSSPKAIRRTRYALRAELSTQIRQALSWERAEQEQLIDTDDFREGVRAWQEKRAPIFRAT